MLNTLAIIQSKLDALNLTQMINEPTRYNPKYVNTGTLIDIILTNLPTKYTSAVFNQDLSDHCLIACIRNGSAVKRPPLITVKRFLKHFSQQTFLIDLAQVPWKDIDLISRGCWLFFKSAFLAILKSAFLTSPYTQAVRKAKASFSSRNLHPVAQTKKSSGTL
jgi:hypothetical protein